MCNAHYVAATGVENTRLDIVSDVTQAVASATIVVYHD